MLQIVTSNKAPMATINNVLPFAQTQLVIAVNACLLKMGIALHWVCSGTVVVVPVLPQGGKTTCNKWNCQLLLS